MDPVAIGGFIDKYGLPLVILGGLLWLLLSGRLVLGSEVIDKDEQLAYREQLRVEERAARLAIEATLKELNAGLSTLTAAVMDLMGTLDAEAKEDARGPTRNR